MQIVTSAECRQKRVTTPTYRSRLLSYFGEAAAVCEGPQVYLVELPDEGSTIKPHFHDVDQYQVFVRGKIGKSAAEPTTFHYADAYTPYGPIIGGRDGIAYFTIRPACASGFFEMPAERETMRGKAGRNLSGRFDTTRPPPAEGVSVRETLLTEPDGVKVVGLRLGPGAAAEGEPSDAGDQYYTVCTGSLTHRGKDIPAMTIIRVSPGEAAPTFKAGRQGAQLLLTQLPRPTSRPGSDITKLAKRETPYKLEASMVVE